jgi:hypothetical protein
MKDACIDSLQKKQSAIVGANPIRVIDVSDSDPLDSCYACAKAKTASNLRGVLVRSNQIGVV